MVEKDEYEFPVSNLRKLLQHDDSEEFHIIIKSKTSEKEERRIKTSLNIARVISDKIDDIYQIDPTITEYEIDIPYISNKKSDMTKELDLYADQFNNLLKSTIEKVEIDKEKKKIFNSILILLGYSNEKELFIESNEEALSLLRTGFHDESIRYISSHLLENVDKGNLSELSIDIVEEIIDSYFSDLQNKPIEDEKQMINEKQKIFAKFVEEGQNNEVIMHFLLNMKYDEYDLAMKKYISENLSDDIIEKELGQIIHLFQRQLLRDETKYSKKPKGKVTKCDFEGNELNGIFSYLEREFNDDLVQSGVLKTASIPTSSTHGSVTDLLKYDSSHINEYFENQTVGEAQEANAWFEFDFCDRKVNITSYTIRSSNRSYVFLKTWKIVGSNDRNNWDTIDYKTDDSSLTGKRVQHRFDCNNNNQQYYRYIRFIQESSWNTYTYNISLTCFELFGSILSP